MDKPFTPEEWNVYSSDLRPRNTQFGRAEINLSGNYQVEFRPSELRQGEIVEDINIELLTE